MTQRKFWTPEEDQILIQIYGNPNEPVSAKDFKKLLNGRCTKQCRERYVNHLDPTKTKHLTESDKRKIDRLCLKYGNHWALIGQQLSIAPNTVKNYYHSKRKHAALLRKIKNKEQSLPEKFVLLCQVAAIKYEQEKERRRINKKKIGCLLNK